MPKFEVGKVYTTRNGLKAKILAWHPNQSRAYIGEVEGYGGKWGPTSWLIDGKEASSYLPTLDLMPEEKYVWINVYKDKEGQLYCYGRRHFSREAADIAASIPTRVGCIKVKLEERFDD